MTNIIHNIFIDGSHKSANSCVGVWDMQTGYEQSFIVDAICSYTVELSALQHALRYIKLNNLENKCRVFTDSKPVYNSMKEEVKHDGVSELIWIPREVNQYADSLSKNRDTAVDLSTPNPKSKLKPKNIIEILNKYPIEKRVKLISKISDTSSKSKNIFTYLFYNRANNIKDIEKQGFYKLICNIIPPELLVNYKAVPYPNKDSLRDLLNRVR
jgi:ribonuclease HI